MCEKIGISCKFNDLDDRLKMKKETEMKVKCNCGNDFETQKNIGELAKCPRCSNLVSVVDPNKLVQKSKSNERNFIDSIAEFFTFRTLISTSLIKLTYFVGAISIILFSINAHNNHREIYGYRSDSLFSTILIIIIANVLWRVICEVSIMFFSMHEILASIEKNTERK